MPIELTPQHDPPSTTPTPGHEMKTYQRQGIQGRNNGYEVIMSDNGSKTIELPGSITVRDLAQRMEASPIQIIKILMSNGVMANINQMIDFDTASVVASEMGFETKSEIYDLPEEQEVGEVPLWRQLIAKED